MGNFIVSYKEPAEAIKKLYKFNKINLDLLRDNIFVELDTHVDYDLYKSYDNYINEILNLQSQLKHKISSSNKEKLLNINEFCYSIKNKYNENYKKYKYQNERRTKYKNDINNFVYNNDPLKIFNLNKNFTMEELKISYRNLARIYHPDKPQGDSNKFKYITQAYLTLMEKLKNKEESKPFNILREDSINYMRNNNNLKNIKLTGKFDNRLFNKIYEENKLYDVTDTGYGKWLKEKTPEKVEIDNPKVFSDNFNIKVFNNIFEKRVQRDNEVVRYNIPNEYNSNDNFLLGNNNIESYSGGVFSNVYDIKDAFTITNIKEPSMKTDNVEILKKERKNLNPLSKQENENYLNYINYNLTEEERRQEGLRNMDKKIEDNYNKINKKMINSSMFSK